VIAFLVLATFALDPSIARLQTEDARLATLAWRIQTANALACPGQHATEFSVHARSQYPRDVQGQLPILDRPVVAAVAQGSAAARAGLRVGDVLLAVDGRDTPLVAGDAGYTPVGDTEAMIDAARATISLTIRREGVSSTVSFTRDKGCASRVQVIPGRSINARADGRYVQINAGMLDFVRNDDELAAVVAHELAHNILKHQTRKTPSKQAEYEADRLSVALVVRAGYRIDAIVPFWTRFEARTNAGIFADGTHPSKKKRIAALTAAVNEFKYGQPLVASPK
jgi:beta-barrel assembly-enhancing protease